MFGLSAVEPRSFGSRVLIQDLPEVQNPCSEIYKLINAILGASRDEARDAERHEAMLIAIDLESHLRTGRRNLDAPFRVLDELLWMRKPFEEAGVDEIQVVKVHAVAGIIHHQAKLACSPRISTSRATNRPPHPAPASGRRTCRRERFAPGRCRGRHGTGPPDRRDRPGQRTSGTRAGAGRSAPPWHVRQFLGHRSLL